MNSRFLVDAQLPPALAEYLRTLGHDAEHVNAIGLGAASDRRIWEYAKKNGAALMTKDGDFSELVRRDADGAPVIWIRIGNVTRRSLLERLGPAMAEIIEALEQGDRLIEIT